jgi:alkaline phosphatase
MKRRDFLVNSSFGAIGVGLGATANCPGRTFGSLRSAANQKAKNIIFLVSDGMSIGTLQMADLFHRMKHGRHTNWIQLYRDRRVQRGLMETASADSYVTDSAAASSAWGGGFRVKNGRLNVGPNNQLHKPIWPKFKQAGKMVGCVTTVPITHATPAGFCICNKSRDAQAEIAEMYLSQKFDVMLGGGSEYFHGDGRSDKRNLFEEFKQAGYHVVQNKNELKQLGTEPSKNGSRKSSSPSPVLGVFHDSGLPYTIDQLAEPELQSKVPTLAEMTAFAIDKMKDSPEGFVLQVEAGKVDWAAHANDTPALIHDQLAFDEALAVAMKFAEQDGNTLVIITTDHGNANPGILGCDDSLKRFPSLMNFKRSHAWIMSGLKQDSKVSEINARIEHALGFAFQSDEVKLLSKQLVNLSDEEIYNDYKLPYPLLAKIAQNYTSVAWAGNDHTGDFVELAMFGPGSELLPPFQRNTELHNFMLKVTECVSELVTQ